MELFMFKKALPLLVLSGVLLVGCTNKEAIPENNETPMKNVRDDAREIIDEIRKGDTNYDPEIDEEGNID